MNLKCKCDNSRLSADAVVCLLAARFSLACHVQSEGCHWSLWPKYRQVQRKFRDCDLEFLFWIVSVVMHRHCWHRKCTTCSFCSSFRACLLPGSSFNTSSKSETRQHQCGLFSHHVKMLHNLRWKKIKTNVRSKVF